MTNAEMIDILNHELKRLSSERGSDYSGVTALRKAIAAMNFVEHMSTLHTCNDCGWKHCPYRPGLGETVRYNCCHWRARDEV